jgi:putative transposase
VVLKIGPSRPGAVVEKRAKSADQLKLWVWQTGYYRFNVVDQRKYLKKLRDIHRNPVKRGLAPSPEP